MQFIGDLIEQRRRNLLSMFIQLIDPYGPGPKWVCLIGVGFFVSAPPASCFSVNCVCVCVCVCVFPPLNFVFLGGGGGGEKCAIAFVWACEGGVEWGGGKGIVRVHYSLLGDELDLTFDLAAIE